MRLQSRRNRALVSANGGSVQSTIGLRNGGAAGINSPLNSVINKGTLFLPRREHTIGSSQASLKTTIDPEGQDQEYIDALHIVTQEQRVKKSMLVVHHMRRLIQ